MPAIDEQKALVDFWTTRARELLQERNNLSREDLEYVVEKTASLKDKRLQECIATLIGWGDEDRAELETFVAISLEVLAHSRPSVVREAARRVEIKSLTKHLRQSQDK